MKILDVLKERNYLFLAIISAIFMFFFLPFVQILGLGNNLDLWFAILLEQNYGFNAVLFLVFSTLFGMFLSFQIYNFKRPRVCPIGKTAKRGILGTIGSGFAFFVGVCPACLGFAGLFLPLAAVSVLTVFGPLFMLISIVLILLSIHLNDGFKNIAHDKTI